ncbi:DNA polymerase III subunit alpha [Alkalispirochaeta alkalica]|uniref:DNA polymerase III subunit alpha n=1 Tax=Alkalispirochaeta alkalica TaxID=46356 RepID=UPI0004781D14|nr:DNA polymerase III subunit alpha [Alkalispirochaeta alkalica]
MSGFVHLHNHSDFSLLKGASSIPGMVARAKELGMSALALTDDGNLFGALSFYQECRAAGIKPLIGCDFYVAPSSRHRKTGLDGANRNGRIVLLARDQEGYSNLRHLSSIGYLEGFYYRPRIDHEVMERHSAGLIALTGALGGEVPRLLLGNRPDEAEKLLEWYCTVYGRENVYLELTDNKIPEQKVLTRMLAQLSEKLDLPLVAANDTHYLTREDANAQDVLLCIGSNRKKAETNRFSFSTQEFYLKSGPEMEELFRDYPQAIANTDLIARRCNLEIELPGPRFPSYDIPEEFASRDDYLRHITWEGVRQRYPSITDEITRRTDYELETIISMGFTGYFLIVWDFIAFARNNAIPVGPGRGSGAGSIVAYALQITDVDPLKYNLLFERFLNPERVSMPDFDIDFCFERRGEVIDYVTRKYGREKVGQIITFGTLKTKSVIRDVARVLGLPYDEADGIAKLVPQDLKMTLSKALEQEPELAALPQRGPVYAELLDVSRRLEGLHRHASTHAAGIVIGEKDLVEYVPLYRDPRTGSISTQFTMDQLEECGLVKMDFLGLKTLTLIKNTEALAKLRNPDFSVAEIPEDDQPTFALLGKGLSKAVFQFESSGMQDILRRARPNRIEDLIALNALYRPGPMQYIDQFVDSKNGRSAITYPLPILEKVLKETYGVIVYQEQVMEIAQLVGGFSLGKADILRRAMGKKKESEMALMEKEFLQGAQEKGYTREQGSLIFELLKPFAGYGFNKSHAAAYSLLAYQTAYLKANFPVEFLAANLTNEINDTDKFADYLQEARTLGIVVRPPNVNTSEKYFGVLQDQVVFGLVGIKNVGSGAVDAILEARTGGGAFQSFLDFLERIDTRTVNRKVIETLIKAGAFDDLGHNRPTLLHNLDIFLEAASHTRENRLAGQVSLFDDTGETGEDRLLIEEQPPWSAAERLEYERELLGFYFSGHPLDDYRERWKETTGVHLGRLKSATLGENLQITGFLRELRVVVTRKGSRMAMGVLEDYNGEVEVVVFPDVYAEIGEELVPRRVVGCRGSLERRKDSVQLVLESLIPLEDLEEKDASTVHLRLLPEDLTEEALYNLRGDLQDLGGNSEILLHLGPPESESVVRVNTQLRVSSRKDVLDQLAQHPLVREVWKV